MTPFVDRFPDLGVRETRVVILPQPAGGLPADRYGFMELYCSARFTEGSGPYRVARAWKGHDWDALNRLHAKGLIGDPVRKTKSVTLTPEGERRARELFEALFGR